MNLRRWLTALFLTTVLLWPGLSRPPEVLAAGSFTANPPAREAAGHSAAGGAAINAADVSGTAAQFESWSALPKPQVTPYTTANVYDIAADGQTLYLFSNGDFYLYKSTDGGYTWSSEGLADLSELYITQLVVSPADSDVVLVSDDYDLYLSLDGGVSFELFNPPTLNPPVYSIDLSAGASGNPAVLVAYAGGLALYYNGVWYDTDNELNWGGYWDEDWDPEWAEAGYEFGVFDPLAAAFSPNFASDYTFLTVLKDYQYEEILVTTCYAKNPTGDWVFKLGINQCTRAGDSSGQIVDEGWDRASIAFPENFQIASATYSKAYISLADSAAEIQGKVMRLDGKPRGTSTSIRSLVYSLECPALCVSSLDFKGLLASGTLAAGCLDSPAIYSIAYVGSATSGFSWRESITNPRSDLLGGAFPATRLRFSPTSTALYAGTDGAPGSAFCVSGDYLNFKAIALISVADLEYISLPTGGYQGAGETTRWITLLDDYSTEYLLFRSLDSGLSWQLVFDSAPDNLPFELFLSPDYDIDSTLYLTQYGQDYFYRSTSGGDSWSLEYYPEGLIPSAFFPIDGTHYRLADESGYRTSLNTTAVNLGGDMPAQIFDLSGCLLVRMESGEWWYSLDDGLSFSASGAEEFIGPTLRFTFGYSQDGWTIYTVDFEGNLCAYTPGLSEEWQILVSLDALPEALQGNLSAVCRSDSADLWYLAADAWSDLNYDGEVDEDEIIRDSAGDPISQVWRTTDLEFFDPLPDTVFTYDDSLVDMDDIEVDLIVESAGPGEAEIFVCLDGVLQNGTYANGWYTFSDREFDLPEILTADLPDGIARQTYSQIISAVGGGYTYGWSVPAGALPAGLSLDFSSGILSGIPQIEGTYNFTVKVSCGAGSAVRDLSLTIQPALTITTGFLPDAALDEVYSQTLSAAWGSGLYTWSIIAGDLPSGLSLDPASGVISGTPQQAGTFRIEAAVSDGSDSYSRLLVLRVPAAGAPLAWGNNYFGQAAETGFNDPLTPWVCGIDEITQVAGGGSHSLALKADGTVWAWGSNEYGQLGDGTTVESSVPVAVTGLSGVSGIAAGGFFSLALKTDGTVWAWGVNSGGQLGDGSYTSRLTPVQVSGLTDVVRIAAGLDHALALKTDGTVRAWGVNWGGQLGDGTFEDKNLPATVEGLLNVIDIAGGIGHSLAVAADGTVWAWGADQYGQLGDDSTVDNPLPRAVNDLSGVAAVAAGGEFSLALKMDGTVWAWGANQYGQLGDGTAQDSGQPVQVAGLSGVMHLSAGLEHSLAQRTDGTVRAWGANWYGQLGDGSLNNALSPVTVSELAQTVGVAAGGSHSLALDTQYRLDLCLPPGENGLDYSAGLTAVNGESPFSWAITSGALPPGLSAGTDGLITGVPLEDGTFQLPVEVTDARNAVLADNVTLTIYPALEILNESLAPARAGVEYSEIIYASGGSGRYRWSLLEGVLPDGLQIYEDTLSGVPTVTGSFPLTIEVADGLTQVSRQLVLQVYQLLEITTVDLPSGSAGTSYNAAFSAAGGAESDYLWTLPTGQLPDGLALDASTGLVHGLPVRTGDFVFSVQVSCGEEAVSAEFTLSIQSGLCLTTAQLPSGCLNQAYTTAAAAANGSGEYTWSLASGTLPDGLALDAAGGVISGTPVSPGFYRFSLQVDDGQESRTRDYLVNITAPGALLAWGTNLSGQLGDGTYEDNYAPHASNLNNVITAAAGGSHSLALKADGTVWAWGDNSRGQLGDGSLSGNNEPVRCGLLSDISAIAAGWNFSLAVKSDGTVWSWGGNNAGQLGNGTVEDQTSPLQIDGLSDIIAVAAGRNFSLALKSDGSVWAWGDNSNGQLGDGTVVARVIPARIDGLSGVAALAAGGQHALALQSDGTVRAWGDNRYGQLGNATQSESRVPRPVSTLTDIIALSAGLDHSLALQTDGTVWAWGCNQYGQLGDGSGQDSSIPVTVSALTEAVALSAGYNHSLTLKADGRVWAWGDGLYGQLGQGYQEQETLPVQISGLSSVVAAEAGLYHNLAVVTNLEYLPDLVVKSCELDNIAYTGTLTYTVKNDGNVVAAGVVRDEVYLSPDQTWDAGDISLGAVESSRNLDPAGQYTDIITYTISVDWPLGDGYYLLLVTDTTAQIQESDEDNNAGVIALPLPDLVISQVVVCDTVFSGLSTDIVWSVENQGDSAAAGPWNDQIWLSEDPILADDRLLTTRVIDDIGTLEPGQSYTLGATLDFPLAEEFIPGVFYFIVQTDSGQSQIESSDLNNSLTTIPVTFVQVYYPDLQPLDLSITADPALISGAALTIDWQNYNGGENATAAAWTDRLLVVNTTTGTTLGSYPLYHDPALEGDLAAGESRGCTLDLTLPDGPDSVGELLFTVTCDVNDDLFENNVEATAEINNTLFTSRNVVLADYPDLAVSDIEIPSSALIHQTLPVAWTISNSGSGEASGNWTAGLYLSADTSLDAADSLIGSVPFTETLAAGGTLPYSAEVQLPAGLSGDWYVGVKLVSDSAQYEADFENNAALSSLPLAILAPDLQVDNISLPSAALAGETIELSWTVSNRGTAAAGSRVDRIVLSPDSLYGGDTLLAEFAYTPGLAAGESGTFSENVTLPSLSGDFYLIVLTDCEDTVEESDETNNSRVSAATLQIVPRIFTTQTELTADPDSSVYGQNVTLTAIITPLIPEGLDPGEAPTGRVILMDNATLLADLALETGGVVDFTVENLTAGSHAVTAWYSGDSQFSASADNLTLSIAAGTTSLSLITSDNSTTYKQAVTFTASISVLAPASGSPSGEVTFMDGTAVLGAAELAVSGQATLTTTTLAAGEHTISALYGGDDNFTGCLSEAVLQTVTRTSSGGGGGGGGGGSSSPTVSPSGFQNAAALTLNSSGQLQTAVQLKSTDNRVRLEIAQGTRMLTGSGGLLTSLSVKPLSEPPACPDNQTLVLAYLLGPEGAQFTPALSLTFNYSPDELPEGTTAEDLFIAVYDGAQWQKLESSLDSTAPSLTAKISHFSRYALLGELTSSSPAGEENPPEDAGPGETPLPSPTPLPVTTPAAATSPTPEPAGAPTEPAEIQTSPASETSSPAAAASTTAPAGVRWPLVIGLIAVLVILAGVIIAVVVRRRRTGQ